MDSTFFLCHTWLKKLIDEYSLNISISSDMLDEFSKMSDSSGSETQDDIFMCNEYDA